MALVSLMGMALASIRVMATNPIRVRKLALCKVLIYYNTHLKQLYLSNKTKHSSYKSGCGIDECMHINVFNRRAGKDYR